MEIEKVLEMFECVERDLWSLQVFELGCNKQINGKSES